MNHEALTQSIELFKAAADKHSGTISNSGLILDTAADDAMELWRAGLLADEFPSQEAYVREEILRRFKSHADGNSKKIRNQLFNSGGWQGVLDLGRDFDSVITVCDAETLNQFYGTTEFTDGRKTPKGALIGDDARLMRKGLEIAMRKNVARYEKVGPIFLAFADELARYGNYQALAARALQ